MNKSKNLCSVLILVIFLGVLIVQMPTAHSDELSASEKMLPFITDVAKIDITKYNATPSSDMVSYPSDLGGLAKVEGGYTLESNEGETHVSYTFKGNILSYCNVHTHTGSTLFIEQPSTNLIERTDAFLQNYQNYLGTSEFQQFRNILATATEVIDTAITTGNLRFEIKLFSLGTRFRWVNTFNGADYTSFSISYKVNSTDFAFSDNRYNKIGSTTVDISKDQAISIAKERAQNISWKVNTSEGVVEISNVTVLDDRIGASLLTSTREPLVLYPYWLVSLTFDKIYPGSVYGVTYSIWADTGEVFYGFLQTLGGSPSGETDTSITLPSSASPSQTPQQSPPQLDDLPDSPPESTTPPSDGPPPQEPQNSGVILPIEYGYATAATVTIIAVATTTLLLKRKRSK